MSEKNIIPNDDVVIEETKEVRVKETTVAREAKALDQLEEKVRLKISVVGIGNAGSQIVSTAHKEGFGTFVINSSLKDLSDTVVNERIPSFIAGEEARGAGKNRIKAKELFKENGKELFAVPRFIDVIEPADIIFVIASTAGGTGSGIAPELINLINRIYPNKIVIFYGIIPKVSDSIIAQLNTIQCLDEVNKLDVPYMLGDLSFYEDVPNDIAYNEIAKHMVDSINVISGKFLNQSNSGMIDENDMRVIVSEPGYMSVYMLDKITQNMADTKSIQSYIIDKIKNSTSAAIQRDDIVKQLGIIVNCPEAMMEASKTGNYNELTKFIGTPLAIFENYSITQAALGQFIAVMSGMNFPYSRLLHCKNKIEEHEEKLKRVKNIDLSDDVDKFSFLDNRGNSSKIMDSNKVKVDKDKKNSVLDDFFN